MDYKAAGVDIEEGYKAVRGYRDLVAGTMNAQVINGIGSFAGMFSLKTLIDAGAGMEDPVLVSGTDGVGTKLDIAFRMQKYDTVGIDCVAMSVNDILCHGARPLFFLDYLACGSLDASIAVDLVKGVAVGCRESGCALLGGETAEMPGFYDPGKYDVAGFAVGLVDKKNIIDGQAIRSGDILIGLASSGAHSNGFSLIRKTLTKLDEDFGGMPLGLALLEPTRIYTKAILPLMEKVCIHGMAHITGGGFYENIPRMFVEPLDAVITQDSWTIPPLFARLAYGIASARNDGKPGPLEGSEAQAEGARLLAKDAKLRKSLFNTYNMGIGFVLATAPEDAEKTVDILEGLGYPAWTIGGVEASSQGAGGLRFVRS